MADRRRTVTFVFTDVEGSTRLLKRLRDRYGEVLAEHQHIVREAFVAHGGEEVDSQGDSFFYVFPRARDAASGAAAAQLALAAHPWPERSEFRIRIGIHTGEPTVSDEGRYQGLGVRRTARIMAIGHGGQILVSQATAAVLADDELPGIHLKDLGEHQLKDLDRPERIYQLDVDGLRREFPSLHSTEVERAPSFRVLGPLEVRGEDDGTLSVPGLKERTILACLIAHAGHSVPADSLVEELWADEPPRTAEKTLGSYISRLRRILEGASRASIDMFGEGYRLDVPDREVDARLFEELALEGRWLVGARQAGEAIEVLEHAIGLWRGDAYQEFRHTHVGMAEGERLGELLRSTQEDLEDARLDLGDVNTAIADLQAMARAEPLRERRWAQLMLALYRAGRQAEALDVFTRARSQLVEELGVEPGAELRQLQAAILAQEPLTQRPWSVEPEAATRAVDVCPYKGLARFEASDADFYFGREQTVARAVARLVDGRFLALIGASGSGKSSLLRAGVLHALETGTLPGSDRWSYVLMRPGEHPLRPFRDAVDDRDPRPPERSVIAIDQFEEAFTACIDEVERVSFLDAIVDATGPDGVTTVIVAMRADFYGRCAEHRAFAELLETAQILVGPMDGDELRRAIELPARRADLDVEEGLTDVLARATAGQAGGLPLLSTTMLELWTQRRDRTLTLDAYRASGGVEGAVARLAEDAYGRLHEDQQAAAERILLRLAVESDGSEVAGRQASLDEFDLGHDAAAERALAALTEARLLTVSDSIVEVAHEALFREWPRLRGWLEDDAQGRSLHRHLTGATRTWEEGGRDDADLYRGARLTSALEWADEHPRDPNELERSFLDRGRSASEGEAARERRTSRRLRGLLVGVVVLLVLALVIGDVAIGQRNEATAQGLAADARQLATRSLSEKDNVLALLIARQAVALQDSPDTQSALLAALEREPAAIRMLYPDGTTPGDVTVWLRLSRDGGMLASGGGRHQVTLFDTATLRKIWTIDVGHATIGGDFDPDGQTLTLATDDRYLMNVDVMSGHITNDVRTGGGLETLRYAANGSIVTAAQTVRYAPDGSIVLAAETDRFGHGSMVAHDPVTLQQMASVEASTTPITAFAFSPDGRRIVSTSLGACPAQTNVDMGTTALWRTRDLSRIGSANVSGSDVIFSEDGHAAFLSGAQGCNSDDGGHLVRLDLDGLRWSDGEPISGHRRGAGLRGVALGADGSVITGGDDGNLTVWDGRTLVKRDAFAGPAGVPERSPQVSRDGKTAYSVDENGTIVVWDLVGDRRLITPFRAGSGSDYDQWFAMSPDGGMLAIPQASPDGHGYFDASLRIVDTRSLRGRYTVPQKSLGGAVPMGFAFSPDGGSLAISGEDHVRVFDARTGSPRGGLFTVPQLEGEQDNLWVDAYSPDGSMIAVAGGGPSQRGVVFLIDAMTHQLIRQLPVTRFPMEWVKFTPDGRRLVGVTETSGRVMVWSVPDGALISDTQVNDSGIYGGDVSSDGRFLVTGGDGSGGIKLFDLSTDTQIGPSFGGPTSTIVSVDVSPSGTTLLGAGDQVYLWDVASGGALGVPFPGGKPTNAASFSPDGRQAYILSRSGEGWVWDVDPASWQTRACAVAGRTLTPQEWSSLLPNRSYEPACA